MADTKDIYRRVDLEIVENGFWISSLEEKKQLIESALINYTHLKALELGITLNEDDNLELLLKDIDSKLGTEKDDYFSNYSHYLLKIAGSIQNSNIIWSIGDDLDLIDSPQVEFDNCGLWSSLKTHLDTSPVHTTLFVLDIFRGSFLNETINIEPNIQK